MANPDKLKASLLAMIDRSTEERGRAAEQRRERLTAGARPFQKFADRAGAALKQAADAIMERAEALQCPSPVIVHSEAGFYDDEHEPRHWVNVTVSMKAPAKAPSMAAAIRGDVGTYSWFWRLSVHAPAGEINRRDPPQITIDAQRGSWVDAWNCDLPTPECNPKGLSLNSSGEEIAKKFMDWFTAYLTP